MILLVRGKDSSMCNPVFAQAFQQLGQPGDPSSVGCRGPSTPRPMPPASRPLPTCMNSSMSSITSSASATVTPSA